MEKSITELIDEKIKCFQELEDILIKVAGSYDNAKYILAKIYHVVNIQKQIDTVSSNEVI